MRIFVLFGLLAGAALTSGGCETVAYSSAERAALIGRTWDIERRQINDDIDSALLLRPPSQLSIWHVR